MRWLALLLVTACVEPGSFVKAPLGDPATTSSTTATAGDSGSGTPSGAGDSGNVESDLCPPEMAEIEGPSGPFCIDRYEAALEGWSPYEVPSADAVAVSGPGYLPQGYISADVAAEACANAGKRLCGREEWEITCQGQPPTTYPYGDTYRAGACNEGRPGHPVVDLFGDATDWSMDQMNDPRINQQADTVDPSGANLDCVTESGVFDLHGNLHEWIDDPNGTFKGGFYVDAVLNGPGCGYTTTAHGTSYHDYSTGFRCCADAGFAAP